ncbi:MAG: hypothetical protein IBJ11_12715 [Phycisphaerales bacterium]|nr:hypothetical protein [Phycisphaerales bacterium]
MARALARFVAVVALASVGLLGGCGARYSVPGPAADFRAMSITRAEADLKTDAPILGRLSREPVAAFPASIAAIRVQGAGYTSYSTRGYGDGDYTVVTNREAEDPAAADRIAALPMVKSLSPINQLVAPARIKGELNLREAAANVQADLTLLYTFDTQFGVQTKVPVLGVITLGLFPSEEARVTSTASYALLDTRTGYVYSLGEAAASRQQLANGWTSATAVEQARLGAEREAFLKLVDVFVADWKQVTERHAARAAR